MLQTHEPSLTNAQRTDLMAQIERDGFFVLPEKLPAELNHRCIAAIDRLSTQQNGSAQQSVKRQNCVDLDAAFLELMLYRPALQLAYDAFGPMFHLCQSNFVRRVCESDNANGLDFVSGTPWHADGPRPNLFPRVHNENGAAMGLHYLKFGYFFTDLTHGNGGSLQVVRGSHRRDELDGDKANFAIDDYANDVVQIDCEAGTIVAFHQAQWHAAPPNQSDIVRKNAYISYCPTWMRALDRETLTSEQAENYAPEARWLLGEPRAPLRWWLPSGDDAQRMARFARDDGAALQWTNFE